MIRNNFDTSSSGVNIRVVCFYDNTQALNLFNENIIRLGYISTYRTRQNLYAFTSCADVGRIGDFCTLKKNIKKTELIALAEELPDFYNGESYTVKELKDLITDASPEMILNDFWRAPFNGLKIKTGFELYNTRGYSQGDSCDVLIKSTDNKEYIDRIFWDAPIYCRVEIDGKDFYFDEIDGADSYDWSKEKMINYVLNAINVDDAKKTIIKKTLSELLPDSPDYE